MPFKKGVSGNSKGRGKGSENAITKQMKTVKETVLNVFNQLQEDPETDLVNFAHKYPRDFHAIAAKLIPAEITAKVEHAEKIFDLTKLTDDELRILAELQSKGRIGEA